MDDRQTVQQQIYFALRKEDGEDLSIEDFRTSFEDAVAQVPEQARATATVWRNCISYERRETDEEMAARHEAHAKHIEFMRNVEVTGPARKHFRVNHETGNIDPIGPLTPGSYTISLSKPGEGKIGKSIAVTISDA